MISRNQERLICEILAIPANHIHRNVLENMGCNTLVSVRARAWAVQKAADIETMVELAAQLRTPVSRAVIESVANPETPARVAELLATMRAVLLREKDEKVKSRGGLDLLPGEARRTTIRRIV